jgi:hypothetical protein
VPSWLSGLSDEDLAFIRRFVLASGSLKDVAKSYGISYPTVRLRLDRLIQKIEILDSQASMSSFERRARVLCAEGRLDASTMRLLLEAYHAEKEAEK